MKQDVSQAKILAQVDALVASRNGNPSLRELGYDHIGIDDGWQVDRQILYLPWIPPDFERNTSWVSCDPY